VNTWRAEGRPIGVIVIPLLFETAAESAFHVIACVACSTATQRVRLKQRGWSESQIAGRLTAQWSMERKMAAAHVVVWTEGELAVHEAQWQRILPRWRKL
jgi:dephospho-CoA kinase